MNAAPLAELEFSAEQREALQTMLADIQGSASIVFHALESIASHAAAGEQMAGEISTCAVSVKTIRDALALLWIALQGNAEIALRASGQEIH